MLPAFRHQPPVFAFLMKPDLAITDEVEEFFAVVCITLSTALTPDFRFPNRRIVETSVAVGQVAVFRTVDGLGFDGSNFVRSACAAINPTVRRFGIGFFRRGGQIAVEKFAELGELVSLGAGHARKIDSSGIDPIRVQQVR